MATQSHLQARRPPASFLQRSLPAWASILFNALFIAIPAGGFIGGVTAGVGYGFSLMVAFANPAVGVVCGVIAGLGLAVGALSFQGKWWQRLICGLVVAGICAAPYALLAAGIAAPWVFGGIAIACAVGACIWLAVCRIRAILNPLTAQQYAAIDKIAPDASEKLEDARNTLKEQLDQNHDDPMLQAIDTRLTECEKNELPGCYAQDKKRMQGANKKQFFWFLSSDKPVDPETQTRMPSERERYQQSATRLNEAFGSMQWFVPYDLKLALDMRLLDMRYQRLHQAREQWQYQPPSQANQLFAEFDRLDIYAQLPLINAQQEQVCQNYPSPPTQAANNFDDLCQRLGQERLSEEQLAQMAPFDIALRGRNRLLEKAHQANRFLSRLEPLYDLSPFSIKDRLRPAPCITMDDAPAESCASDALRERSSSRP